MNARITKKHNKQMIATATKLLVALEEGIRFSLFKWSERNDRAYSWVDYTLDGLYCDPETGEWEKDVPRFMTVFLDKNAEILSKNWLYNSKRGVGYTLFESDDLNELCNRFEIDLPHLLWGDQSIIRKTRYVLICERNKNYRVKGWYFDITQKKYYEINEF